MPDASAEWTSLDLAYHSSGACSLAIVRPSKGGKVGGGEVSPLLKSLTPIHITAYERAHVRHVASTHGMYKIKACWRRRTDFGCGINLNENPISPPRNMCMRGGRPSSEQLRTQGIPFSQRRLPPVSHNPRTPVTRDRLGHFESAGVCRRSRDSYRVLFRDGQSPLPRKMTVC